MQIVIDIDEEVIKHAKEMTEGSMDEYEAIRAIANGTPLKEGHWIEVDNGYICSECDIIRAKGTTGKYNYCPNCGCRMKGEIE